MTYLKLPASRLRSRSTKDMLQNLHEYAEKSVTVVDVAGEVFQKLHWAKYKGSQVGHVLDKKHADHEVGATWHLHAVRFSWPALFGFKSCNLLCILLLLFLILLLL